MNSLAEKSNGSHRHKMDIRLFSSVVRAKCHSSRYTGPPGAIRHVTTPRAANVELSITLLSLLNAAPENSSCFVAAFAIAAAIVG